MNGVNYVSIIPNYDDENLITGRYKPPLFVSTRPESVNILVDGKDKISAGDTPWNFTVNMSANMFRVKNITCQKVVVPKINNITKFNNQIVIKHELGTTSSFTLQPAFYNTSSLSNEITSKVNSQFLLDGIADTITTSFDSVTKTFNISSVGSKKFFFDDTCTFITRGTWCANFAGEPLANVPSTTSINSGRASLLYTRYFTIHSSALTLWSLGDSRTSNSAQGGDIIAVIDVCSIYNDLDFDVSTPFAGAFKAIKTPEAGFLNCANSQKNLNDLIDISCKCEWGNDMNEVMDLGAGYPANKVGPSLWFELYF